MTNHLRTALVGFALALALGTAGCKQSQGDRCQLDSDCGDGLTCVIPAGMSVASGGTCQLIGSAPDGGDDAATGGKDIAPGFPDMASSADGPPSADGPEADAAADDAAPPGDDAGMANDLAVPDLSPLPDLQMSDLSAPASDAKPGDGSPKG